jgi:hypothetical protein
VAERVERQVEVDRNVLFGMTSAMAAGLEDNEWTIDELVALLESAESAKVALS